MQRLFAIILTGLTLTYVLSCSSTIKKVNSSLVSIRISSSVAMLDIRPATPLGKVRRFISQVFSTSSADAAIPTIVQSLRLTVSAPDMNTIIASMPVAGLSSPDFVVEVPNGTQRHFMVDGLDATGVRQYTGDTFADLIGNPAQLTINMVLATDITPPVFGGVTSITVVSSSAVQLSWNHATDNVTPQPNIVYLVYQSTTPSGEVYSTPTYTTAPGATGYSVIGLIPGTTYYFVAR